MNFELKYEEACKSLEIYGDYDDDILEITLTKQYRKLSRIYHPDKNKALNASEQFQKINDSYQYLSKYLGYIDDDDENYEDISERDDVFTWNFKWMYEVNKIIEDNIFLKNIKSIVVDKIVNQENVVQYIDSLDEIKLIEMYEYLNSNRVNVPEYLLTVLSNVIESKKKYIHLCTPIVNIQGCKTI